MLEKNMLTIITVCYNEKDIERTCKSIAEQTFQNFEWILIDGGSNKETLDILNKYKNRINIFISKKDNGIYNAMNKGIKLASGRWLIFMNGGDSFFNNTTLEKIFIKNGSALKKFDILYCDSLYHDINGKITYKQFPDKLSYMFWRNDCINHQASFIRKELFSKNGLYDEKFQICADYEKFVLFYKEKYKFKHLKIIASNFFLGGISSNNKKVLINEKKMIMDKHFNFEYETIYTLKLFDKFPFARIKKRRDNGKYAFILLKNIIFTWNVFG